MRNLICFACGTQGTGHEVSRTALGKDTAGYGWGLSFSADSQTLACSPGPKDSKGKTPEVTLFAAANGHEVAHWDTNLGTGHLAYSPDGKFLAQSGWDPMVIRDAKTGLLAVDANRKAACPCHVG